MTQKLETNFFARDPRRVARELVGRQFVRKYESQLYSVTITETGAYRGEARRKDDGLRYGPGIIHIYKAQRGNNVICIGTETPGVPAVVTIREGVYSSRGKERLLDGPNSLSEFLRIGRNFDGQPLRSANAWIEGKGVKDSMIEYIPYSRKEKMSDNCLGYYRLKQ